MMQIEHKLPRQRFDPATTRHLWVVLDDHSRTVRHILFGDAAEDLVQELCRALRQDRPTPLVTDNGTTPRASRKGSQGNVER